MINMNLRTWLRLILLGVLCAMTGWSFDRLHKAREEAEVEAATLSQCRRLEHRIKNLKKGPSLAVNQEMLLTEVNRTIEKAVKHNGITLESIEHITQERSKRYEDTPYKEKPIRFDLHDVTLEELIRVLHELTTGASPLGVSALFLKVPRGEEKGERWSAEASLTYLIYSPQRAD